MNDFDRLLEPLQKLFEAHAVPHMVVGSTAVGWLATPRVTNDVDIVVAPTHQQLQAIVRRLNELDFYFDDKSAFEAFDRKSMVNAIDPTTGMKVDFIMLDDEAFHREEFDRRLSIETPAGRFSVQTPEDLILSKLRWGKESASEKQFRDVVGVFDIWRPKLDIDYLKRWADEIGVRDLLDELFTRPL